MTKVWRSAGFARALVRCQLIHHLIAVGIFVFFTYQQKRKLTQSYGRMRISILICHLFTIPMIRGNEDRSIFG